MGFRRKKVDDGVTQEDIFGHDRIAILEERGMLTAEQAARIRGEKKSKRPSKATQAEQNAALDAYLAEHPVDWSDWPDQAPQAPEEPSAESPAPRELFVEKAQRATVLEFTRVDLPSDLLKEAIEELEQTDEWKRFQEATEWMNNKCNELLSNGLRFDLDIGWQKLMKRYEENIIKPVEEKFREIAKEKGQ